MLLDLIRIFPHESIFFPPWIQFEPGTSERYFFCSFYIWSLYYKEKDQEFPTADIDKYFQIESISLLLNLYSIAAGQATRETTFDILNTYAGDREIITYSIEQLLVAEKRSVDYTFYDLAQKFSNEENPLIQSLVQRVVYHAILHLDCLSPQNTQSLVSKFFKDKLAKKEVIRERRKNYFKKI